MRTTTDADAAVLREVRRRGGVVRSAHLTAGGHSQRVIARLVADGRLLRVRRVWVALPDADPFAVAAARAGVVVSCVTAAQRAGLWVPELPAAPHVAAAPHGPSVPVAIGTVVHWAEPLVPRPPDMLFDTIENALALIGACQPRETARVVLDSALNKGLATRESLLRLPLTAYMRELVEESVPWADSGLETYFVVRLRWLRLPIRSQIWIAGHRVDILIGDRLVVQVDGGHHVGRQRDQDIAHDAALTLMGYHVIRVGYDMVVNRWHELQELIMRAVAQGLHRAA